MPTNPQFFSEQSEQSRVKAHIVASYFSAWAGVIQKWDSNMGYIDLFCGPGKYGDNNPSAPLLIIEKILSSTILTRKMLLLFNDQDATNTATLKHEIDILDSKGLLKDKIAYYNRTIDRDTYRQLSISRLPVLSFVDPFGYKGLTLQLIDKLISNNGSDCIFFFNYNRVNMALNNHLFDDHLMGIFGEQRTYEIKKQLNGLAPAQREPVILEALTEALRENKSNYVLPFKFYSTEMLRTSHYIIFVTKHPIACKIMKQIMYANSAKDADGIADFSYKDSRNFSSKSEQLTIWGTPMDRLIRSILSMGQGTSICVGDLCNKYDTDFTTHYVGKNVQDALKRMELSGQIEVVDGRKYQYRAGKLTMPTKAIIRIK